MRKKVFGRQFSRETGSRTALFRSVIRSLVKHGQITTTLAKAKSIQGEMDKIFTTVKKDTVNSRRNVFSKLGNDKETVNKLFSEYLPIVKERSSGYTRILKLGRRKGDQSEIAKIEILDRPQKSLSAKVSKKEVIKKDTLKKKKVIKKSKGSKNENLSTKK